MAPISRIHICLDYVKQDTYFDRGTKALLVAQIQMFLPCKPLWEPDQNFSHHYRQFIHFKPLMEKQIYQIYHLGPRKWEGGGRSKQSFSAYFLLLNVCFRALSFRPCNLTTEKETYRVVFHTRLRGSDFGALLFRCGTEGLA